MNVVIYTRVSTDEQATSGLGLAAQMAACESFAAKAGHTITASHDDPGVSGAASLEDRAGLMAAVACLRSGDALVIAKRCRLGRDQMAILMIEKAVSRLGAVILSADGVGNTDDPTGQLMKGIVDQFGIYERAMIRSRTKAALAAKRAAGELAGEVPFGWVADATGRLVAVEAEQAILRIIGELRQAGVSLRKIASILTTAGHRTKKGGTEWSHTTIKSILDRQAALAA